MARTNSAVQDADEDQDEEEVINVSEEEAEDAAHKARKRLGLPEYNPDEALMSSIPKIMFLGSIYTSMNCSHAAAASYPTAAKPGTPWASASRRLPSWQQNFRYRA